MFHDEEIFLLKGFLFLSCPGIQICGQSNVRCVLRPYGLGEAGGEGGGLLWENCSCVSSGLSWPVSLSVILFLPLHPSAFPPPLTVSLPLMFPSYFFLPDESVCLTISCPLSCVLPSISYLLSLSVFQIGEERATAISLMRKFIAYQFTDTVSLGRQLGDERLARAQREGEGWVHAIAY